MTAHFTIAITKEILRQSKNCSNQAPENGSNCAIAIALKDIFPDVYVSGFCIFPFGNSSEKTHNICIPLPPVAQQFIKLFDGFYLTPKLRMLLPEFDFTIGIPDEVIDRIDIEELKSVICVANENDHHRKPPGTIPHQFNLNIQKQLLYS